MADTWQSMGLGRSSACEDVIPPMDLQIGTCRGTIRGLLAVTKAFDSV